MEKEKEKDIVLKLINGKQDSIVSSENALLYKKTTKVQYELYDKDTYNLKLREQKNKLEYLRNKVEAVMIEITNFQGCTEECFSDCMCLETMKESLCSYENDIKKTKLYIEYLELILETLK
jgi:hypothetical protein